MSSKETICLNNVSVDADGWIRDSFGAVIGTTVSTENVETIKERQRESVKGSPILPEFAIIQNDIRLMVLNLLLVQTTPYSNAKAITDMVMVDKDIIEFTLRDNEYIDVSLKCLFPNHGDGVGSVGTTWRVPFPCPIRPMPGIIFEQDEEGVVSIVGINKGSDYVKS